LIEIYLAQTTAADGNVNNSGLALAETFKK